MNKRHLTETAKLTMLIEQAPLAELDAICDKEHQSRSYMIRKFIREGVGRYNDRKGK